MADTGKSVRSPHKAVKTKSVRSNKALSTASPNQQTAIYHDSDDSDQEPVPLPRSHTPGHLASKSINDKRRKPSDLAIRQRSQSASQVSNASSSTYVAKASVVSNGSAEPTAEDEEKEKKRPSGSRTNSSMGGSSRKALSSSATARQTTRVTRPPRGQHVPFPPLPDPKNAPDVEPAPASGMYWSKAFVSGSPHSNLRAHTTTLIGSNVYIFGGCDSRTCFNAVYVLDGDAFYWSVPHMVGDIPMPLRAMTCTAVGKKLVVFGGGDGPAYYNDVYVLDTVNFRWTKPRIVGDKVPSKRRAHTACLYKNGIYVFGGGDGVRALNDIWRLDVSDPTKMSWKLISGPEKSSSSSTKDYRPKARGYHTANMVGSKLIIFGGSDGGECFDDVWVYDVETHVWKAVSIPVTYRRLSHTATIVGSYLFVLGGHDGNDYCNDVLLLNLVTMTWDKRKVYGKPPSGRGYHGTVLYDSRLLVIGGFDGSEVFGDVTILELAVHAYYSQISHFTIEV
ncbi:galactose oxidase, central domain-containing protein [Pochonia chlamydosporia 170]|uniref:Galactose oxidase, central domain-containing protein n=1 Tax=Pochonia chlamydosporia 170 TaxID=1380566 RepID=A0A179FP92_METCM|nr:galactose oxidase, central domain-containing protein [Pochonia chlamydosporia 170]OAQ66961.1 galactose oxidase, central domain-containing protein [Pochonia chlamydosporia 170]